MIDTATIDLALQAFYGKHGYIGDLYRAQMRLALEAASLPLPRRP